MKIQLHECCNNCEHSYLRAPYFECEINKQHIKNIYKMGGSNKCECYERYKPPKEEKFIYPKKYEGI